MPTNTIYLDHAATTPLDSAVVRAMEPFYEHTYANPSSLYAAARASRLAVESARQQIARVLGAKVTEVVFTSGGTEGNNLAVQGVLRAHPGASWVTSTIEHDAILACVEPLKRQGHRARVVPVKPSGLVDLEALQRAVHDDTVLVSVMLANNEIGTIQPIAEIAKMVANVRIDRATRGLELPLYLHTDAVQAANYLDLHVTRLGVDLLTLNGSKMYGPKGTGALYVRHSVTLEPLLYGGGQERMRRSGTENVAGIVGLATAFEKAATLRDQESRRLTQLRDQLLKSITIALPDVVLNGSLRHRLPNNLNLTIPGAEGEGLVLYLDKAGIMASTGSACSTGNLDPSHVLLALGRSPEQANSSLRLTLGRSTDEQAIAAVVETLPQVTRRLRQL